MIGVYGWLRAAAVIDWRGHLSDLMHHPVQRDSHYYKGIEGGEVSVMKVLLNVFPFSAKYLQLALSQISTHLLVNPVQFILAGIGFSLKHTMFGGNIVK